jgi:hypothetical protein
MLLAVMEVHSKQFVARLDFASCYLNLNFELKICIDLPQRFGTTADCDKYEYAPPEVLLSLP